MIAVQLCSGLFPGIQYPRVPGHEIAGIIEGVGKDVNTTVIHYV
jgi:D-arabinose 1-dehydrogenase-like Zn-dependent alcohol dehydrogenase